MSKISIALCTYNGARYLHDQLVSIRLQSRQPDEMIVCDDQSSDESVKILKNFSRHFSFPCKIIVNSENLKPTKNFENAIRQCSGDYIALSDQDDYWHPDKLKNCECLLENNKNAGAVFTNADIVDSAMNQLGYTVWDRSNFNRKEQNKVSKGAALSVLLKHYIVTGSTLMLRASLRPLLLPIPGVWFHDAWIALLVASVSGLVYIPNSLMRYRQHSNNHLGGIRKSLLREIRDACLVDRKNFYRLELFKYRSLYDRVSIAGIAKVPESLRLIDEKIKHLEARASMPLNRFLRIPLISKELRFLGYHRYARNWGSIAMDLIFK